MFEKIMLCENLWDYRDFLKRTAIPSLSFYQSTYEFKIQMNGADGEFLFQLRDWDLFGFESALLMVENTKEGLV